MASFTQQAGGDSLHAVLVGLSADLTALTAIVAPASTGVSDSSTAMDPTYEQAVSNSEGVQELLDHCKAARDATQRALRCAMEHLEQSGCRGPEQGKMEGEEATGKDVKEGLQGEEEGPGACLQEGAASGRQDERQQQDTVEDWGEEEEFSIPEIGLSSASLAAINGLPAAEGMQGGALLASPALLDDKTSTLELYDQVIRQPRRTQQLSQRRTDGEGTGSHSSPLPPSAANTAGCSTPAPAPGGGSRLPKTPTTAVCPRSGAPRPQSSIRKPLANVNYSELVGQRSAFKALRSSTKSAAGRVSIRPVDPVEFDSMPGFLSSRLSLEQLNAAATTIATAAGKDATLPAAELSRLRLGPSAQSVLGCLVRLDRVRLDTSESGDMVYRVLQA
eukprot:jgi/Tetstr1/441713/TSEL_029936.t1